MNRSGNPYYFKNRHITLLSNDKGKRVVIDSNNKIVLDSIDFSCSSANGAFIKCFIGGNHDPDSTRNLFTVTGSSSTYYYATPRYVHTFGSGILETTRYDADNDSYKIILTRPIEITQGITFVVETDDSYFNEGDNWAIHINYRELTI